MRKTNVFCFPSATIKYTGSLRSEESMHDSNLSGEELCRYATKQVELWVEFGWVDECDKEAEIERLIESARKHNTYRGPN